MADMENELKDLREKNNELVQKVQYWKMTAAQRENEKLELMKEINDLRLKLSRIRSGGAAHAHKLDAALQTASEEALSHLVQASSAVARTLELAKTYMRDRQELDTDLPRWSTLSNTPSSDKVNRVPPMLIGGRLMQPVVSLSRTLQSNNSSSVNRSPNQHHRSGSERALPMHMLQDVYISLTRIDTGEIQNNNLGTDTEENHTDESNEELSLEDSSGRIMEVSQNSEMDNFEESGLDPVAEDVEPDEDTPPRPRVDPLEGPSWLLDEPRTKRKLNTLPNSEPDSTTEFDERADDASAAGPSRAFRQLEQSERARCEFSPTVRRRRASPPPAPAPRARRLSNNGRILKVLVAKMRLDEDEASDVTPPKRRPLRFDAPSPNGSTDSRVIVLETPNNQTEPCNPDVSNARTSNRADGYDNRNSQENNNITNNHNSVDSRNSRANQSSLTMNSNNHSSVDSRDSDSSGSEMTEGRTRRPRKAVVYKEKPLNRKLRR